MFCRRKYWVDPGNKEQVKRMNAQLQGKKYQFVAGRGGDVLKGWCGDARVDADGFLVLTEVILDMGKNGRLKEYQEHSELRFFNTPYGAFINEGLTGGEEGKKTGQEEK